MLAIVGMRSQAYMSTLCTMFAIVCNGYNCTLCFHDCWNNGVLCTVHGSVGDAANHENTIFPALQASKRIFLGVVDKPNGVPPHISGIWDCSVSLFFAFILVLTPCSKVQSMSFILFSRYVRGMNGEGQNK